MNYKWYRVFNLTEFLEGDFVSREYEVFLSGVGIKTVMACAGRHTTGMVYEDRYFMIDYGREGSEPVLYMDGDMASYIDVNNNVYLGFEVES